MGSPYVAGETSTTPIFCFILFSLNLDLTLGFCVFQIYEPKIDEAVEHLGIFM
jgi:hypothetical protein